jgi:glycerophosphoryl diester phosphodiesterase
MRREGLVGLLALLAGLATTPALAEPVCGQTERMTQLQAEWLRPRGGLMIAAHRAGHLKAPENSLAAVEEAVEAGADLIEIDVKVSADGVPFLMHDQTVARTTGGAGAAESLTYAQVRALRLADGSPPPTLLEALRSACGRVMVDLDLKTDRVAPVVAVVEGLGMTDQVLFFDSDSAVLAQVRGLAPDAEVMPRVSRPDGLSEAVQGLAPVRVVHGDTDSLTPPLRSEIRTLGARVWVNSLGQVDAAVAADTPEVCSRLGALLDLDANIIQTDRPSDLRRALSSCRLGPKP